jgi:hypothetical protein
MKLFFTLVCFCAITGSAFAQDTTRVDSSGNTLALQPFVGLGILNGGRVGVAMKINDVVTVEAGLGLNLGGTIAILTVLLPTPFPATFGGAFSQGIILTPFSNVSRLSFMLYNAYNFANGKTMSAIQMMAGFILYDGETSDFRMSIGHAIRYAGESSIYRKLMYGVDFVLTF